MGARKKAILVSVALIGVFTLCMSVGAIAANPTGVSVSANVPSTIQLNMPITAVNFGGGPLAPGSSYTQVITASINSNKGWSLKVTKDHDLLGGTSAETIPSADLTFTSASADPNVTVKVLTPTEFPTVAQGAATAVGGTRGSSISSSISYSLTVPWDQAPDTYSATHTYTATQP